MVQLKKNNLSLWYDHRDIHSILIYYIFFSTFIKRSQRSILIIPNLWLKDSLAIYTTQKQLN